MAIRELSLQERLYEEERRRLALTLSSLSEDLERLQERVDITSDYASPLFEARRMLIAARSALWDARLVVGFRCMASADSGCKYRGNDEKTWPILQLATCNADKRTSCKQRH